MDFINFQAEEIAKHLGIERLVETAKGLCMLDIGCGEYAGFPRYLSSKGIEAYGIDPELREEIISINPQRFIKQRIGAYYPQIGSIPCPNGKYNFTVIHQNNILNETFTIFGDSQYFNVNFADEMQELRKRNNVEGPAILTEALRVTKDCGIVIAYPGLDRIERYFPQIKDSGWQYVHLNANGVLSWEAIIESEQTSPEDCSSSILKRTVFYKTGSKLFELVK